MPTDDPVQLERAVQIQRAELSAMRETVARLAWLSSSDGTTRPPLSPGDRSLVWFVRGTALSMAFSPFLLAAYFLYC